MMAEAFHEAGYIEKWGKGIGIVMEVCRDADIPEPVFTVRQNGLDVAFVLNGDTNTPAVRNKGLTESQKAVLEAVKNGCRTRAEISAVTFLSDATVKRAIGTLIDIRLLKRIGAKRTGYWEIIDE
jgi:ATP-dependent DNA helicase RecG